ncbi:MAG: gliding motility-associated C-terminal domain-containing protein [Saprospiraceae bacterium]|nr:gliding motility-associated C-terminal domain-containing protein [Saprospiraceae bacterium]
MRIICILFLSIALFSFRLQAQTNIGLVAYYSFNIGPQDDTGNSANTGVEIGDPSYVCGVSGQALRLDGGDDALVVLGTDNVNKEFDTEDISISFYFKPVGVNGTQYLLSKRSADCGDENIFYIRYVPQTRTINAAMIQDPLKGVSLVHTIDNTSCWQHVALVRENLRLKMYVNGQFAGDLGTASRVDILNDGNFTIGSSNCIGGNEVPFDGLIDELRIYNRALKEAEIEGLQLSPDMIDNRDTLIFLGSPIQIRLNNSCATLYEWTPAGDVNPSNTPEPVITPSQAGTFTYTLRLSDNVSTCVASDSLRVTVVDPNTLVCDVVYLPRAFTPNGDDLNDEYGISNPFALQELIFFEIFDRWGNRVFYTTDPFAKWDGTYNGQTINPGVLLYRISHVCNGVELLATGSLTLLK